MYKVLFASMESTMVKEDEVFSDWSVWKICNSLSDAVLAIANELFNDAEMGTEYAYRIVKEEG